MFGKKKDKKKTYTRAERMNMQMFLSTNDPVYLPSHIPADEARQWQNNKLNPNQVDNSILPR